MFVLNDQWSLIIHFPHNLFHTTCKLNISTLQPLGHFTNFPHCNVSRSGLVEPINFQATRLKRKYWWQNMKMMAIIGVVVAVILLIIIISATSG